MKIAHISDIHYCAEHLEEVDRCFTAAVEKARDEKCGAAILSGDLWDRRLDLHAPAVARALNAVWTLADAMPVLILQGTYSHDVPGSLEVFKHMDTDFHIKVADKIERVVLYQGGWVSFEPGSSLENAELLVSCLPSINKGAVAAAYGAQDAAEKVGDVVADLLASWAPVHVQAREMSIPTMVVSHGTVNGCITEHGVPMAGLDHEFTVGSLAASQAHAVALGHIHKHQSWLHNGTVIAYPGSVGRLHFGEKDPKGFIVWDTDVLVAGQGTVYDFIPTPARDLLEITFDGPPDMESLIETAANAVTETPAEHIHVRVRYQVDEEHRHSVDRAAIEDLFAEFGTLKIEGRINPIQRQRAAGITHEMTLAGKLRQWCEVTQTEAAPLLERLAELETKDVEELV